MNDNIEQQLKEIAQNTRDPSWPKAGEVWKHYKGGVYDVLALAIHESELRPLVIYKSREFDYVWARPVQNWLELVWVGGQGTARFERVN